MAVFFGGITQATDLDYNKDPYKVEIFMEGSIDLHKDVVKLKKIIRNLRKKIARLKSYSPSENLQTEQLEALKNLPSHELRLAKLLEDQKILDQEVLNFHESKRKDLVVVNFLNHRRFRNGEKLRSLEKNLARLDQATEEPSMNNEEAREELRLNIQSCQSLEVSLKNLYDDFLESSPF